MPELMFDTEEEMDAWVDSLPVVSDDPDVQSLYAVSRLNGESHVFAEMCALRTPPGTKNTDRAFREGSLHGGRYQGNELWLRAARAKYKRATGHDVPQGMVYISQIASEPGDPRAWVDGLGDVKNRLRELGHGSDDLGIKEEVSRPKKVVMADDLMKRHLRKAVADPANFGKNVNDLKEQVVEKYAYNASKLED